MGDIQIVDPPYDYSNIPELEIKLPKLICCSGRKHTIYCSEDLKKCTDILNKFMTKVHKKEKVVMHLKRQYMDYFGNCQHMFITNYARTICFTTKTYIDWNNGKRCETYETNYYTATSYNFWINPEKIKIIQSDIAIENTKDISMYIIENKNMIFKLLKEIEEKDVIIRKYQLGT